MRRLTLLSVVLACALPQQAFAQRAPHRFAQSPAQPLAITQAEESERSPVVAFVVEAAGASVGSFIGFSIMAELLRKNCDFEDVVCEVASAAASAGVATAGSVGGVYLAGRVAHTNPSMLGATIGAVLGAGAGVGMWHFVREEVEIGMSDSGAIALYAVTQGIVTALGSRIARALE
ncbi:MAG TPA: hypothetical protein VGD27_14535 [Longimicrobiales bacterium]